MKVSLILAAAISLSSLQALAFGSKANTFGICKISIFIINSGDEQLAPEQNTLLKTKGYTLITTPSSEIVEKEILYVDFSRYSTQKRVMILPGMLEPLIRKSHMTAQVFAKINNVEYAVTAVLKSGGRGDDDKNKLISKALKSLPNCR